LDEFKLARNVDLAFAADVSAEKLRIFSQKRSRQSSWIDGFF